VQLELPLATPSDTQGLRYLVALELDAHGGRAGAQRLLVVPPALLHRETGHLEVMKADGHALAEALVFPPPRTAPHLALGAHPALAAETREIATNHDERSHDVRITVANTSPRPQLFEIWLRRARKARIVVADGAPDVATREVEPVRDATLDIDALVRLPWTARTGSSSVVVRWWE
jgi:hypothetical protein